MTDLAADLGGPTDPLLPLINHADPTWRFGTRRTLDAPLQQIAIRLRIAIPALADPATTQLYAVDAAAYADLLESLLTGQFDADEALDTLAALDAPTGMQRWAGDRATTLAVAQAADSIAARLLDDDAIDAMIAPSQVPWLLACLRGQQVYDPARFAAAADTREDAADEDHAANR